MRLVILWLNVVLLWCGVCGQQTAQPVVQSAQPVVQYAQPQQTAEPTLRDIKSEMDEIKNMLINRNTETTGQTRDGGDDDDEEEYVPESETAVKARISAFNRGIAAMDAELLRQQGAIESEIKRLHPAGTVERAEKLQQLETNIQKMKDGNTQAKEQYEKKEMDNFNTKKSGKEQKGFKAYIAKIDVDGVTSKLSSAADAVGQIATLIDPTKSWQERTEAGLSMAASIVEMLPSPIGEIGSAILNLVAGCFGASAPSTDEYLKLRNQILDGVTDLFDESQKGEAMGCVYKIEFIKAILDRHKSDVMTEKEFYAIILMGGIDVGVSTLGTLKYKMMTYRDKNTIKNGRRALDMAHFYVLVSQQRDLLYEQIIQFIGLSGSKAGITSVFFKKTRSIAKSDYKYLFFFDDLCCEKNPGYFSTMLAYTMPIKKHYGKDKAVHVIRKFLDTHRDQKYYDDPDMGMSAEFYLKVDDTAASDGVKVGYVPDISDKWVGFGNKKSPTKYLGLYDKLQTWIGKGPYNNGNSNWWVCDPDAAETEKYILHMGITSSLDYGRMKITWTDDMEKDRFSGTVVIKSMEKDFYLTGRDKLKSGGTYLTETYQAIDRSTKVSAMKTEMSTDMKASDILGMCASGKRYGGTTQSNWRTKIGTESLRFFPVRMTGWKGTRYLVGPAGNLIEDDLILFGASTTGKSNGLVVPDVEIDDNDAKEMSLSRLSEDDWNNVWFKMILDDGKYPVTIGSTDKLLTCNMQANTYPGTHTTWVKSYQYKREEDCIADCALKRQTDSGINAVNFYKGSSCSCYKGLKTTSTSSGYHTCYIGLTNV